MTSGVSFRLSVMMFLEYVIWGSWLPLLALYLGDSLHFTSREIGLVFATPAIASLWALFVGGQIADRYLSGEKMLALSHLIGGIALLALGRQTAFWPFFVLMLVYQLVYVPTLSVTNAIAFHNLQGREREFGRVRLWGTIGWIAASWPFVFILAGRTGAELETARGAIFTIAAVASFALSAFSFSLPATPPSKAAGGNAPLEALKLLAIPAFAVLFLVTLLDAIVHQCYFQWTSPFLKHAGLAENWIMPAMSVGQIAEIATMAALGVFLARLGWRKTMIIGVLGHAARFLIFAIGDPVWLMVAVNVVHGLCYAFFFATVYIFIDEYSPRASRASTQGLFNLLILGLGPFLGSLLWGQLGDTLRLADGGVDYRTLFLWPAGIAFAAALALFLFFRPVARETV
jgi:nucleoside transporter